MEGPDLIKETSKKVLLIQERLRIAFSRQQSYADPKRRDVQFNVGDHIFLKISPMKRIMRFGKKEKLALRYIGHFKILDKVGNVSYILALPPYMSQVHLVFRILMLQKYVSDPTHVLQVQEVTVGEDLSYEEIHVAIIDRQFKRLRSKYITMVQWQRHNTDECT